MSFFKKSSLNSIKPQEWPQLKLDPATTAPSPKSQPAANNSQSEAVKNVAISTLNNQPKSAAAPVQSTQSIKEKPVANWDSKSAIPEMKQHWEVQDVDVSDWDAAPQKKKPQIAEKSASVWQSFKQGCNAYKNRYEKFAGFTAYSETLAAVDKSCQQSAKSSPGKYLWPLAFIFLGIIVFPIGRALISLAGLIPFAFAYAFSFGMPKVEDKKIENQKNAIEMTSQVTKPEPVSNNTAQKSAPLLKVPVFVQECHRLLVEIAEQVKEPRKNEAFIFKKFLELAATQAPDMNILAEVGPEVGPVVTKFRIVAKGMNSIPDGENLTFLENLLRKAFIETYFKDQPAVTVNTASANTAPAQQSDPVVQAKKEPASSNFVRECADMLNAMEQQIMNPSANRDFIYNKFLSLVSPQVPESNKEKAFDDLDALFTVAAMTSLGAPNIKILREIFKQAFLDCANKQKAPVAQAKKEPASSNFVRECADMLNAMEQQIMNPSANRDFIYNKFLSLVSPQVPESNKEKAFDDLDALFTVAAMTSLGAPNIKILREIFKQAFLDCANKQKAPAAQAKKEMEAKPRAVDNLPSFVGVEKTTLANSLPVQEKGRLENEDRAELEMQNMLSNPEKRAQLHQEFARTLMAQLPTAAHTTKAQEDISVPATLLSKLPTFDKVEGDIVRVPKDDFARQVFNEEYAKSKELARQEDRLRDNSLKAFRRLNH